MASTTTTSAAEDLPLGTSPPFARMHRRIRRVCYVLLFALVIEGALTFPLLALWYGVPDLSPKQVCSELQKVMYSDDSRECETHSFPQPPFSRPSEAEGQTTSKDTWGVQPKPGYDSVEYRELVENHQQREVGNRE
jgi:hypothetical protein